MKRLPALFVFMLYSAVILAQVPRGFNYQAVYRDASGNTISNQNVSVIVYILEGSVDGTELFTETHVCTTNDFGLITLTIGSVNADDFNDIDWSGGPYFLKININGTLMGTSQLLSVPFALYAETAENLASPVSESDPLFSASEAANITAADITNLDNLSGTNTGDQDISGIAQNTQAIIDTASQIRNTIQNINPSGNESDPVYTASPSAGIIEADLENWNEAYSWGNHQDAGYLTFYPDISSNDYKIQVINPNLLFMGRLYTAADVPVNGIISITAEIYDSEVAVTALWMETSYVTVNNGYFRMPLGNQTSLPVELFAEPDLYLGFTIGASAPTNRFRLAEVGRAKIADRILDMGDGSGLDADLLDGYSSEEFLRDETDPVFSAHPASDITADDITNWDLVQWSEISDIPSDFADGTDDNNIYTPGTGLTLSNGVFSVNSASVQLRVVGTCPAGASIRAISSTGTVTCEFDDNTWVTNTNSMAGIVTAGGTNYNSFWRTDGTGNPSWGTLGASDVPDIDWDKISSGKPTTLSGYGITDAVSGSQIIKGIIDNTGTIISGDGFTCSKSGTGTYTITFTSAFGTVPVCTASEYGDGLHIIGTTPATGSIGVHTRNYSGVLEDASFTFIVIGD